MATSLTFRKPFSFITAWTCGEDQKGFMSFVSSSAFIAILFLLSLDCLFQPPHPPHHHPHHYRHFRSGNTELCTVCTILRFPFLKDFSYYSMEAGQEQRIVPESCWHSSVAHLEKRTERAQVRAR